MLSDHIRGSSIISTLLAIFGLALMFLSVYFGTSLGDSWLVTQESGVADMNRYNLIVETYKQNFVIIGGILFAGGLLTAILTYLSTQLRGL